MTCATKTNISAHSKFSSMYKPLYDYSHGHITYERLEARLLRSPRAIYSMLDNIRNYFRSTLSIAKNNPYIFYRCGIRHAQFDRGYCEQNFLETPLEEQPHLWSRLQAKDLLILFKRTVNRVITPIHLPFFLIFSSIS